LPSLNHLGVFFKEEPIRQLQASLERKGFEVVYPVDVADLLKLIEKNPRVCSAIFDWDKYSWACARRSIATRSCRSSPSPTTSPPWTFT
jgi:nucleoside 2-deoxyribosyltransferase